MKTNRNLPIAVVLVIFFFTAAVFSQMVELSTKELTETSVAVFVGKCVQKESYWTEKKDKILTRITFKVDQYVKGDEGPEAVIIMPGGRVGNLVYQVSDMPVFVEGEESLLFLWKNPKGKNIVTGALHGKRTIHKDKNTGRKIILDRKAKHEEEKEPHGKGFAQKRLLNDYVDEIKSYLKK